MALYGWSPFRSLCTPFQLTVMSHRLVWTWSFVWNGTCVLLGIDRLELFIQYVGLVLAVAFQESLLVFKRGYTICFLTFALNKAPKAFRVFLAFFADILHVHSVGLSSLPLDFMLETLVSIAVSFLVSLPGLPIRSLFPLN